MSDEQKKSYKQAQDDLLGLWFMCSEQEKRDQRTKVTPETPAQKKERLRRTRQEADILGI